MNKKISLGVAISIVALVAAIAVTITYTFAMRKFEERMSSVTDRQFTYAMLTEIESKVRQKYAGDINYDTLLNEMADGLVDSLGDEACKYLSESEYDIEKNELEGYEFGIGIEVSRATDGNILVNRVHAGSPAATAGIQKGDVVTYVNSTSVLSMGYDKAVAQIGDAKADVSVKVLRGEDSISFKMTKASFVKSSVQYSINSGVGCIQIFDFNSRTLAQFNSAYSAIRSAGNISGLIIDIRDTTGGSLQEYATACTVLDTLLPQGNLMLSVNSDGSSKVLYSSDSKGIDLKMVVLVNEKTAGAAELFASAIYDYGKCYIVGVPSYGQMTIQEYFELSDGSAIKLTTGTWKTDTCAAISEGRIGGGAYFYNVPMSSYQETNRYILKVEEDPQLSTAIELLKADEKNNVSSSDAAAAATTATTAAA